MYRIEGSGTSAENPVTSSLVRLSEWAKFWIYVGRRRCCINHKGVTGVCIIACSSPSNRVESNRVRPDISLLLRTYLVKCGVRPECILVHLNITISSYLVLVQRLLACQHPDFSYALPVLSIRLFTQINGLPSSLHHPLGAPSQGTQPQCVFTQIPTKLHQPRFS